MVSIRDSRSEICDRHSTLCSSITSAYSEAFAMLLTLIVAHHTYLYLVLLFLLLLLLLRDECVQSAIVSQ